MPENISDLSHAVSNKLTGAYAEKRLTQETVAERAGMSIWTVQKKLRGRSPVSVTDLVVLAQAIGVEPSHILDEAMKEVGLESAMSDVPVSLDAHRQRRTPATMTEDEMEDVSNAANTDPEHQADEPEQP